jgi:peptidoglycan hydrolase-like protein with peptidoglycan-binding domain
VATLKYGSRGDAVKRLQRALNDNPYRKPSRNLVVDGQFGTLTAAAVQGTKFWMGYPKSGVRPVAGDPFMALATKRKPLPVTYRVRRNLRIKNLKEKRAATQQQTNLRLRALDIIKGELGTLEKPKNSNHIKYNTWWGWGKVAYCVIGISWAWVKAGSKAFLRGVRWANTDVMLEDAKAERHGIHLTSNPKPGCPGVIDFDGHSDPDHAITFVKDNGDGTCQTIEFNTVGPSGLEGVFNKRRPLRNCWWFTVQK